MFLIPNNTFEERISKADGVSIMKVNQLTWRAICQRSVSVTRAHALFFQPNHDIEHTNDS